VQARERFRAELPVLPLDARDPAAAAALAPWLMPGDTLAVLGSSGAGKSTLTNTLLGESLQLTGAARAGDGRGRHTTTVRSLHRLPGGACLIDTPGLRTLRLEADEAALDVAHGEVAELALGCRFRDCRHQAEPGCAVRAGLDADRLKSYHRLQREARRDTLTVLQRQRQLGEWKSIHKSVRTRMAVKRG
jgi:ribosome biogenesis GTPase